MSIYSDLMLSARLSQRVEEEVIESTETLVSIFLEEQEEVEAFENWLAENELDQQ